MNPKITLLAAMLLLGKVASAVPFDRAGWTWERPVVLSEPGDRLIAIPVTPELFDGLQPDLHDVRILDRKGQQTPYFVRWHSRTSREEPVQHKARLLDRTQTHEGGIRVTADFGAPLEKNSIDVRLDGRNYCQRVLVEGGHQPDAFEHLADNLWLIDVQDPRQQTACRVDRLTLPVNTFRYLRITLYETQDQPMQVRVREISTPRHASVQPTAIPIPVRTMEMVEEPKTGNTLLEVDFGYRNLPLERLVLQVDTPLYHRGVRVEGRNETMVTTQRNTESGWKETEIEAPWQSAASGVIYRKQHLNQVNESNEIALHNARFRYLRLTIINNDNPPLIITSVSAERNQADIVFMAESNQQYALLGGNPKAMAPKYDLEQTITPLSEATKHPAAELGPSNPIAQSENPIPWTERHPWLIWCALIIIVLAMTMVIQLNLRRFMEKTDDPT